MRKALKNIVNFGGDIYDKIYITYREVLFYNYYHKTHMTSEIPDILTDEEKKQVDAFYKENLGKKHSRRYHNVYKYYSGKFNKNFFPEDLIILRVERNIIDEHFGYVLSDKNFMPIIAEKAGVKTPRIIVFSTRDLFFDGDYNMISREEAKEIIKKEKAFIVKPSIETGGGRDFSIYDSIAGYDEITDETVEEIFEKYGTDFAVQEKIINSEQIRKIYPQSLNTFRIITYIHDKEIKHTLSVLRLGGGGARMDNATQGGMYVGVRDDGSLNDFAVDDFQHINIREHGDTGTVFKGYKIEGYEKMVQAAKNMHRFLPKIGIINWDFTLDENNEPILIESNTIGGGGYQMIQCAHGEPVFGEDTKDILKWVGKISKLSKSKRKKMKLHL